MAEIARNSLEIRIVTNLILRMANAANFLDIDIKFCILNYYQQVRLLHMLRFTRTLEIGAMEMETLELWENP